MIEWNIQTRAHVCQSCARRFGDKQAYHTLLFDEPQGFERLDVCEPCWTAQYSQGATDRKGFISHWQGVFESPPARPEPIQRESAESLLRKLVEQNDPRHAAACFILAAMLERKRVLKVKDQTQRDGLRVFIYEHSKTGDAFTIADPKLLLDQLDEVQRDVSQLLEHGLEPIPAGAQASTNPTVSTEIPPATLTSGESPDQPAKQPAVC